MQLEGILKDETGFEMITDDLDGFIMLLFEVAGVRLTNLFLEPK